MITNVGYMRSNLYTTMSMEEACGQMMADTTEILNELQMSILLTEHEYLRENGVEINYLNEAGKMASVKEKFLKAIKTIGQKISDLWDKLSSWFQDRYEAVTDFVLHHIGSPKKYREAVNYLELQKKTFWEPIFIENKGIKKYVDFGKFNNDIVSNFDNPLDNDGNPKDLVKMYVYDLKDNNVSNFRYSLDYARESIDLLESGKSYLKGIRELKKSSMAKLKSMEKEVIAIGNTSENGEDIGSNYKVYDREDGKLDKNMEHIRNLIKAINKVSHDAVKVYHIHISNMVSVLNTICIISKQIKYGTNSIKHSNG